MGKEAEDVGSVKKYWGKDASKKWRTLFHSFSSFSLDHQSKEKFIFTSSVFFKWAQLQPLFCLFSVFPNKKYNFYKKSMWNKCRVHPVYGAGFWTFSLLNMSRLPWPLGQDSSVFVWTAYLSVCKPTTRLSKWPLSIQQFVKYFLTRTYK